MASQTPPRSKNWPSPPKHVASRAVPVSRTGSFSPLVEAATQAAARILTPSSSPEKQRRDMSHDEASAETHDSDQENRNMIVDTVAGMKDLAVESVSGFREWASSPNVSLDSQSSMDDLKRWVLSSPRPTKKNHADGTSPDQAVHSLYGEKPNYQTVTKIYSDEKPSSIEKRSLVQDLMSPFLACSSGLGHLPRPNKDTFSRVSRAVSKVMPSNNTAAEEARSFPFERRTESYSSLVSLDTQLEDEMYQIQRLTSWNTVATENTFGTHVTYETLITEGTSPSQTRVIVSEGSAAPTSKKVVMATTDDDGNAIPPAFVSKAKKQKRRRRTRRKRVVQFDYPPIRSVKECPRVDPEDLDKLFFTEEELDQYEDDRYNTRMADDVEIVAVASPLSEEEWHSPSNSSRLAQKQRKTPESSAPVLTEASESSGSDKSNRKRRPCPEHREQPPRGSLPHTGTRSNGSLQVKKKKNPRLLKGVQIYMRERSTGSTTGR